MTANPIPRDQKARIRNPSGHIKHFFDTDESFNCSLRTIWLDIRYSIIILNHNHIKCSQCTRIGNYWKYADNTDYFNHLNNMIKNVVQIINFEYYKFSEGTYYLGDMLPVEYQRRCSTQKR
jgi:hypothetical protein